MADSPCSSRISMIQVPVYNMAGETVDHFEVDEQWLGGAVNRPLLRQAAVAYEANRRSGTAEAKTRSEVSHSGRKLWRQKGTGRARHRTRSSPIWVGGGVAHGPRARDFRQKLNRKVRVRALLSAVLAKMLDGEAKVLDRLELPVPKTREMAALLRNLGVERSFLIVLPDPDPMLWRCTRNIPASAMKIADDLNAYDVLRARQLVFTREALQKFLNNRALKPIAKAVAIGAVHEEEGSE